MVLQISKSYAFTPLENVLIIPENFWPARLLGEAFKQNRPPPLFHINAHVGALAVLRTLLGTPYSPLLCSSGTPAFVAHVQQLEMLTHCSASWTSLISFRPWRPRGVDHDGISQQSLCASETAKILINSGLALWQYNRLLCPRLRLREGHENQGWAAGADRSFWVAENFWTAWKSDILPMGIQKSLQPGKLV